MKKNNSLIKEIFAKCFGKEKDERWNAVAMLLIFFLFLAVVIVIARTNNNQNTLKPEEVEQTPTPSLTATPDLEEEPGIDQEIGNGNYEVNYSYLYTFTLNGVQEIITGKRLDSKEIFSIINTEGTVEYARLSENYLKKENGSYHLTNLPSTNLVYANLDPLLEILEELIPSIEINQYIYNVPTSEILKSYHNNSTLVDQNNTYNRVVITRGENTIERIDLDYSNLYSLLNGIAGNYNITMEFNNVGTTEDFTIRID